MTTDHILAMLREILEREFEIPSAAVSPEADLADDLDLDSLDAVVLLMSVEQRTSLELSVDDLKGLRTVQEVVDSIEARLAGVRADPR